MGAKLRQIGGSTVVTIPPALLKQSGLQKDAEVDITVKADAVIIRAKSRRKRYTLAELMAQCDLKAPAKRSKDEQAFLDSPPDGKEVI